jgi:ankyrin repeat protein
MTLKWVQMLFENGADYSKRNIGEWTVLH